MENRINFKPNKKKLERNNSLNYIIAIPTLRCNFSCSTVEFQSLSKF